MTDNELRIELRRTLQILYNENAILTVVAKDLYACFYRWSRRLKAEKEIPYSIAYQIINQNLVELESGNDYYGEENYVANKEAIEKIANTVRYSVGDTVKATLKDYEDIELSGFVTGCLLHELEYVYINDIRIYPCKIALTRRMLTEKTVMKYGIRGPLAHIYIK